MFGQPGAGNLKMRGLVVGPLILAAAVALGLWCFLGRGENAKDLLKSTDRRERVRGIEALRGRSDEASRKELENLCGDRDARVAVVAVWALAQHRDAESRQTMSRLLADTSAPPKVRAAAAEALGAQPEADCQELIGALTCETNAAVRVGAAKGLYTMRKVVSVPALFDGLDDPDDRVRHWSFAALSRLMPRRFPYDPEVSPAQQAAAIREIGAYLKECGALK